MNRRCLAAVLASVGAAAILELPSAACAQGLPTAAALAAATARRFPQPVRVGALLGRAVLQPLESQPVLGRVKELVKNADGTLSVIVRFGGLRGYFGRLIAVPIDAMALLGEYIEIVEYTPEQLAGFKTFDDAGAALVPADTVIRVGIARPSH